MESIQRRWRQCPGLPAALVVLITNGIHLFVWALLMHKGLLEPLWLLWRLYALATFVWCIFQFGYDNDAVRTMQIACPCMWFVTLAGWLLWCILTWQFSVPEWRWLFYVILGFSQLVSFVLALISKIIRG